MAGVVSPSMWVFVLRDEAHDRTELVHPQRGAGQGAALRRVRPRGDRPAALDVRRCSARRWRRRCARTGRSTSRRSIGQMVQMGDEGHNRNRAGTLMLLRDLLPDARRAGGLPAAEVARVARFIGGNDHFFLNLVMPAGKLQTAAAAGIPGVHRGHRDGPQRHRLRHPGLRHRRRAGSPARPPCRTASSSARTGRTTPTPTSATRRSPRPSGSAASRWPAPRRSSGSSAARCPTRCARPGEMYEITLAREPGLRAAGARLPRRRRPGST